MIKISKIGEALKDEYHRRALYWSLIFIMLMILLFLLVSLEEPDPPLEEEIVEITMEDIELDLGSQPEGGSQSTADDPAPVENVVENTEPVAEEVQIQEESPVVVPTSNGDSERENTQPETPPVDNTFTFGGGNGNGQGDGSGDDFGGGSGVGGNGQGNTPGDGTYNPNRKVINEPKPNLNAQEEGKIALEMWVDANGTVVKTRFFEAKSTSGSAYLISLAKKEAVKFKYSSKPGARIEKVGYKIFNFYKQ